MLAIQICRIMFDLSYLARYLSHENEIRLFCGEMKWSVNDSENNCYAVEEKNIYSTKNKSKSSYFSLVIRHIGLIALEMCFEAWKMNFDHPTGNIDSSNEQFFFHSVASHQTKPPSKF